jgi:A/G-specific adenine glycosylase
LRRAAGCRFHASPRDRRFIFPLESALSRPRATANLSASDRKRIEAARTALLGFFDAHKRDLPWRRTADPYAIWVSEVMLQQTRVETVIPYYQRFLERFPTVRALADAPLDEVLAQWAGLGYYRRARMLHAGACAVRDDHAGVVPNERDALELLPGVGAYTAGAIASIAFGRREPVVDGNVERVVTRLFALEGNPRTASGKRHIWQLAQAFADGPRPGDLNQSLMELGATVCGPVGPKCLVCPVRAQCMANTRGEPERFPELPARKAVREERWAALVVTDAKQSRVWLVPAPEGRWHGMLLPPMEMLATEATADQLLEQADQVASCGSVTHVLTHAAMKISVHRGTLRARKPPRGEWVPIEEVATRAVPKITLAVLQAAGLAVREARRER